MLYFETYQKNYKTRGDLVYDVVLNNGQISARNLTKILESGKIPNAPSFALTTLSMLVKQNKLEKCGYELPTPPSRRRSKMYKIVDPATNSNNGNLEMSSFVMTKEEGITSKPTTHYNPDIITCIDKSLSNMRKQLIDELAPLLKLKKQFINVKNELNETLDEIERLKIEIQKRDDVILAIHKKIQNQSEEIIEEFARFFNVKIDCIKTLLKDNNHNEHVSSNQMN